MLSRLTPTCWQQHPKGGELHFQETCSYSSVLSYVSFIFGASLHILLVLSMIRDARVGLDNIFLFFLYWK